MSRRDDLIYEIELIKAHLRYRLIYGIAEALESTLEILEQELRELEEKNVEKFNDFANTNGMQFPRTQTGDPEKTNKKQKAPDEDAD